MLTFYKQLHSSTCDMVIKWSDDDDDDDDGDDDDNDDDTQERTRILIL